MWSTVGWLRGVVYSGRCDWLLGGIVGNLGDSPEVVRYTFIWLIRWKGKGGGMDWGGWMEWGGGMAWGDRVERRDGMRRSVEILCVSVARVYSLKCCTPVSCCQQHEVLFRFVHKWSNRLTGLSLLPILHS